MNKQINQKCDEIEGMIKTFSLETQTGRLNMSLLALDQFNSVVLPALNEIRAENKTLLAKIAELEDKLKPENLKGGPVLVKNEEKKAVSE